MSGFNVDFFDFAFLVEKSLPPNTMTRLMFLRRVVDEYYDKMTPAEREHLYLYVSGKDGYDLDNKDVVLFNARFDPNNQYRVLAENEGQEEYHFAFKLPEDDRFYINSKTWVTPSLVKSYEKI